MKLAVDYINNPNGKTKAVQLSFTNYKKLLAKIEKYEQLLKIKSELTQAFKEVRLIRKGKIKSKTLSEFLSEL